MLGYFTQDKKQLFIDAIQADIQDNNIEAELAGIWPKIKLKEEQL